ncbi:MAG: FG-GAP-like repeat-containing protein [Gammaproteobacteria bacterium]
MNVPKPRGRFAEINMRHALVFPHRLMISVALLLAGILCAGSTWATAVGRLAAEFGVSGSGAATYEMPISVAAGRGGLKPVIGLRYSSQDGDQEAGMGFSITGLSRISRCAHSIAVDGRVQGVQFASDDRFCLDGRPLILVAGSYGADGAEYRTEVDNLQRVISRGRQGTGPASFEVQHPDGLTWRYGNDGDSRADASGTGGEVREWLVNEVSDKFSNRIDYDWLIDLGSGERLPLEIRWTNDGSGQGARFRLLFRYAARPVEDQRVMHLWGATWQRVYRLGQIRYEFDAGSGFELIHRYTLAYNNGISSDSGRSQVSSVQQCGPTECLPATNLVWQNGVRGLDTTQPGPTDALAGTALFADHDGDGDADLYLPVNVGGTERWHVRLTDAGAANVYVAAPINTGVASYGTGRVLEYDGDGRRDLLAQGAGSPATWFVHRSNGAGGFLPPVNTGLTTDTVHTPLPMDVDGDGLDDLVYVRDYIVRIRRNTGAGFGPEQTTSLGTNGGGGIQLMPVIEGTAGMPDFDGDGRKDLLVWRGSLGLGGPPWYYEGFRSTGDDFQSLFTTPPALDAVVLDLNGDGLSDLAYRDRATGWQTRRSLGKQMESPESAGFYTPIGHIVRAMDYNHDGRDDLLFRLGGDTWRILLAGGGIYGPALSNSDPSRYVDIADGPTPANTIRLAPTDINGDGLVDLVFLDNTGRWQVRKHKGSQPDLLVGATDGLGNIFQPTYQSLSRSAAYTHSGTAPAGDYLLHGGSLPVVTQYTANDGAGGTYTSNYAYWNARVNRLGRGFLGFEKIRATDSRYAALHGVAVYSETSYRQDFPFIGLPALVVTRGSDGRKLREQGSAWSNHVVGSAPADAAGNYHFPYLQSETTNEYETDPDGGGPGQLSRTTTRTLTYDFNHGQPIREATSISSPASSLILNSTITTTYSDDARLAQHCLGLPIRVDTTRDISSADASTRTMIYTWSAKTCRLISEVSGQPGPASRQLLSQRVWNAAGQLLHLIRLPADGSAPGRRTTWTYDTWSDRPRTESAIISGQSSPTVTTEWNHALDVQLSRTSPRGLVTRWIWDDFGRLRQEAPSDGPATDYSYSTCSGGCFSARGAYQLSALRSDGVASTSIYDRFGRIVGQETSLAAGNSSRQIMEFDALGRLMRQTVPYVAGEPQFWVQNRFDVGGQKLSEDKPAGESGGTASTLWSFNRLTRTVRDAENRVTTRTLDPAGRLIAVNSVSGGTASYSYTAFGELASITDANGIRTTLAHDARGNTTVVDSPDTGRRTSAYNAFGELMSQSDAASPANVISYSYDQLGRLVQRNDAGQGQTTWTFNDSAGSLLGLPRQVSGPLGNDSNGFLEKYSYDPLGRRTATTTTIAGQEYTTNYSWDGFGRLASMTYPATVYGNRMYLDFRYDAGVVDVVEQDLAPGWGYMLRLYDLQEQDALGRERHVRLGSWNAIDETRDFDRANTYLKSIRTQSATQSGQGSRVQDYAYQWDKAGNLLKRQDLGHGLTEDFSYDDQNRLETARLNNNLTLALSYDAGGRIRSKSDVGNYVYGSSHPGAITAVGAGPAGNRTYSYDNNGNMTLRNGSAITWYPFQMPKRINQGGADYAEFAYGPDRQRIRQIARTGGKTVTTLYVAPHFEVEISGTTRRYRSTVFANGEAIYSQVEQDNPASLQGYFLHRDHQGSIDSLSRAVGAGSQTIAQNFDAFGKRRNPDWTADPGEARARDEHYLERGYTGHEHLDNVRLIHMNGRVQDPYLGTMLAPDPVIGNLLNPQSLSRYNYVASNPASLVDPSGYFLGRIGKFFKRLVSGAGNLVRRVVDNYGREILAGVAAYYTGGLAGSWYAASVSGATAAGVSTVSAITGGAVAGGIATGELRGAAIGAVSGAAFGTVASYNGNQWTAARVAESGVVGGLTAEASGGDFRDGFIYAGGAAGFGYAYNKIVRYGASWSPGGAAQGKERFTMPIEGANNFAEARPIIDPTTFTGEGGRLSRFMNRIPGMNAIAGMHDVFQVRLDQFGGDRFGHLLRASLSFPGMPVAAGLTYPALFDGVPSVALTIED